MAVLNIFLPTLFLNNVRADYKQEIAKSPILNKKAILKTNYSKLLLTESKQSLIFVSKINRAQFLPKS